MEGEAAWREPGAGQGKDETEGKRGKANGWMGGRVAIAETTKDGYLHLADLAEWIAKCYKLFVSAPAKRAKSLPDHMDR